MTDIVCVPQDASWLVVGWFTPDYRHWAERLARSLDTQQAPHHLFAKDGSPEGWMANTRRKPRIAIEAIARFPDKTIVLTDVDAEATGNIAPMVATQADVSAYLKAKLTRNGRVELQLSSRVIVIRPTAPARQFISDWESECARVEGHVADEAALALVLARSEKLAFQPLDVRFAARERDVAPKDAVLVHDSARDVSLAAFNMRKFLKRKLSGQG